ncbi:MAG: hypothetical protein QOE11_3196 [Solirubrobacteraceae bacterium]|jgi:hypothetical protein|nr:hypothetical protein [Solirubrobacteraceae bacterium]
MSLPALRTFARTFLLTVAVVVAAAAGSTPAFARGGGGDSSGSGGGSGSGRGGGADVRPAVRVAGTCGKGASSSLRVRSRDGGLETEFEVHGRTVASWRVTIVHEQQVAWRGSRRTIGASRSFSVGYRLPDYAGADAVTARAVGPRGVVCTASVTLPG